MARIAVVADDLTGANDTGIQFYKKGLTTAVLLGSGESQAQVVVADSDSRRDPAGAARSKVIKTLENLIKQKPRYWYKKIDSTLRGNLGAELEVMLDYLDVPFALICPAFPATGRTVVGGLLLVNGTPVDQTDFAKDVLNPVTSSCILEVLAQQTALPGGRISLSDLNQGIEYCTAKVKALLAQGIRIICADADIDEDLSLLGQLLAQWPDSPPLAVGSAGLAANLPGFWYQDEKSVLPVLVVAGSVSAVTRQQCEGLLKHGAAAFDLSPADLLIDSDNLTNIADLITKKLGAGQSVVVRTAEDPAKVSQAQALGEKLGFNSPETSAAIAEALGRLSSLILAGKPLLAGLVLTGGDVAVRVLTALSVTSLDVLADVAPGVPVVKIADGLAQGVNLVTKAGGFGAPDVLVLAVNKLQELSK